MADIQEKILQMKSRKLLEQKSKLQKETNSINSLFYQKDGSSNAAFRGLKSAEDYGKIARNF